MEHAIDKIIKKPVLEGQIGESHIWDGPLDQTGRPHSPGSSSGIRGMKLGTAPVSYMPGPITKKAQRG